jgi:hypothetical protein
MDEEQKMFTYQKYSVTSEHGIAPILVAFFKTSSIIANKRLLRDRNVLPAIGAMVEAAP